MNASNEMLQIQLEGISKSYNRNRALDKVTMHIKRHEVLGLIGENGAGKSTLLKILGGIHQPDSGVMKINGQETILRGPASAAAAGIGVVHQEQSLIETLSVAENICLGAGDPHEASNAGKVSRFGFFRWTAVEKEGQAALARIGSAISARAKVASLSFADRQMVEIAKAVRMATRAGSDPVIILDEPTSVLEKGDIERLEHEINRLKTIGSVIFVSHRLDEIRRICDRVYVLRSGQIVGESLASEIDDEKLFFMMTGRTMIQRRPATRTEKFIGQDLLRVEKASRRGEFMDVSLTVERGQVHAIVGTRNSGREELCRVLFGINTVEQGSIRLNGELLTKSGIPQSISRGIAYLPSERKVEGMVGGMTVAENISLSHRGNSHVASFLSSKGQIGEANRWIKQLDIRPPDPRTDISSLSGGNQQKAVLAKWAKDPALQLLVLDHPTRGVDPGAREHINGLIDELCARGVGVVLLADTLDEALMLGHRISVMRDGEVTASFRNEGDDAPEMATLVEHMV